MVGGWISFSSGSFSGDVLILGGVSAYIGCYMYLSFALSFFFKISWDEDKESSCTYFLTSDSGIQTWSWWLWLKKRFFKWVIFCKKEAPLKTFKRNTALKRPFGEAQVRQSKINYQGCEMFRLKWFHGFIMVSSTSTRSYCHPKPGGMLFWTQNSLKESHAQTWPRSASTSHRSAKTLVNS